MSYSDGELHDVDLVMESSAALFEPKIDRKRDEKGWLLQPRVWRRLWLVQFVRKKKVEDEGGVFSIGPGYMQVQVFALIGVHLALA